MYCDEFVLWLYYHLIIFLKVLSSEMDPAEIRPANNHCVWAGKLSSDLRDYDQAVGGRGRVGCQWLTVDCRVSRLLVVIDSWLSGVGCQMLVIDCLGRLLIVFPVSVPSSAFKI